MLLSTVNPAAAASIGNITKVGVGNRVVYHARAGVMRDRRSSFPADVLRQHDDGSLDLLVFMDLEDFALESRVAFQSHNQPHHCWSVVTDVPQASTDNEADGPEPGSITWAEAGETIQELLARVEALEAENRRDRGLQSKPAKKK